MCEFLLSGVGQKYVMTNVGVFMRNNIGKCVSLHTHFLKHIHAAPCLYLHMHHYERQLLSQNRKCVSGKKNKSYRNSYVIHFEINI